jgi:antitoxin component YwqK of YwqJK toxin-antitoxin module
MNKIKLTKMSKETIFIERFRSDNKTLKFTGHYIEMPKELVNKPIGTEIFPEEYETGYPKNRAKVFKWMSSVGAGYRDGLAIWYWENGNVKRKVMHKEGIPVGLNESYYENGQLKEKGNNIENGRRFGLWETFDEKGNKIKEKKYL